MWCKCFMFSVFSKILYSSGSQTCPGGPPALHILCVSLYHSWFSSSVGTARPEVGDMQNVQCWGYFMERFENHCLKAMLNPLILVNRIVSTCINPGYIYLLLVNWTGVDHCLGQYIIQNIVINKLYKYKTFVNYYIKLYLMVYRRLCQKKSPFWQSDPHSHYYSCFLWIVLAQSGFSSSVIRWWEYSLFISPRVSVNVC